MGSWGITMRQSDCGLDLLGIIVEEQLRKVDFATFNVTDALEVLRRNIQNEIEQYRQRQRPPELKEFYMESLSHDFTNAALLVAECLADYYRTGELIVFDYVGENYDPVKHHIKNVIVTETDLQPLLVELESVQNPEHWKYQGWVSEEILQQWLKHIRSVYQTLHEHA